MKTKLIEMLHGTKVKTLSDRKDILCQFEVFVKCKDYDQNNPNHSFTLLEHILVAYEEGLNLDMNELGLIALLFHDIGKVDTQTKDENGYYRFIGHPKRSLELFNEFITTPTTKDYLDLTDKEIREIKFLIEKHEMGMLSTKTWRKYVEDIGEDTCFLLLDIRACDIMAQSTLNRQEKLDILASNEEKLSEVVEKKGAELVLAIKGGDLVRIGIQPGPGISSIMSNLTHLVKSGVLENVAEILLDYATKKFIGNGVKKFWE